MFSMREDRHQDRGHGPTYRANTSRNASSLRRSLALVATLMLAMASVAQAADGVSRLSGVVNLNTANSEQLQMLPGVGEKRAAEIIDIRTSKGGFKSVNDLVEVKGVGEKMLERLRPHLSVSGKTTAKLL